MRRNNHTLDLTQAINIEALYALLPTAPRLPWKAVAGLCESAVAPVYRTLQRTLSEDVEQLAAMLAELELQNEANEVCPLVLRRRRIVDRLNCRTSSQYLNLVRT